MNDRAWYLHFFQVTDESAQEVATAVICGSPGLAVHTATSGRGHYVFVDAPGDLQARLAYDLVRCADARAVLLHTARGPEAAAHRGADVFPLPVGRQPNPTR